MIATNLLVEDVCHVCPPCHKLWINNKGIKPITQKLVLISGSVIYFIYEYIFPMFLLLVAKLFSCFNSTQ